ncbi:MAG: hypothetical protein JWN52_6644 [Actinomycetia bacterium]|nr:hypothetical protein [Actinomycetes bacterium]
MTDTDLAARRATAAGGTVQGDPWDSPYGRIATVQDPLGATFRVIRSAENPLDDPERAVAGSGGNQAIG